MSLMNKEIGTFTVEQFFSYKSFWIGDPFDPSSQALHLLQRS